MEFAAARRRRDDEHDLVIVAAWYVEAIRQMTLRKKQLPNLKHLLVRQSDAAPTRQTSRDHLQTLQTLSAQYGIPLKVAKKD